MHLIKRNLIYVLMHYIRFICFPSPISETVFIEFMEFAIILVAFSFDVLMYRQIDGIAISSNVQYLFWILWKGFADTYWKSSVLLSISWWYILNFWQEREVWGYPWIIEWIASSIIVYIWKEKQLFSWCGCTVVKHSFSDFCVPQAKFLPDCTHVGMLFVTNNKI